MKFQRSRVSLISPLQKQKKKKLILFYSITEIRGSNHHLISIAFFYSLFWRRIILIFFKRKVNMADSQSGELKMEGWLYIIRSNRIGLQYSRKRYFILEDHLLKSFKSIRISNPQVSSLFSFIYIYILVCS